MAWPRCVTEHRQAWLRAQCPHPLVTYARGGPLQASVSSSVKQTFVNSWIVPSILVGHPWPLGAHPTPVLLARRPDAWLTHMSHASSWTLGLSRALRVKAGVSGFLPAEAMGCTGLGGHWD